MQPLSELFDDIFPVALGQTSPAVKFDHKKQNRRKRAYHQKGSVVVLSVR